MRFLSETSWDLGPGLTESFSKPKIKTKTRRSSVDLKKIFDEELPNFLKRFGPKVLQRYQNDFKLKISQRSQRDLGKKRYEDVLKKINVDLLNYY